MESSHHDASEHVEQEPWSRPSATVDLAAAETAATALIEALGADLTDPSLANTPARVARAYAEMLTPQPFDLTTFPNDAGYDELVLATGIKFHALCEHHLLPFVGVAHVGYIPRDKIIGLSKLARVVEHFSRRLQVQERMTMQIASVLEDELEPKGVGVVLSAEHMCMSIRGVHAQGTQTVTSAVKGLLRTSDRSRAEFLALTNRPNQA